jgi:hypothetical protein
MVVLNRACAKHVILTSLPASFLQDAKISKRFRHYILECRFSSRQERTEGGLMVCLWTASYSFGSKTASTVDAKSYGTKVAVN